MFRRKHSQQGQTLIETVVAVFILVMGIVAALGLANYSLNATTGIRKQIIAMGLAREGIEAVKSMRDTNWLNATLSTTCYNFYSGNSDGACYKNWLNPGVNGYNIDPGPGKASLTYSLWYDPAQSGLSYWHLVSQASGASKYGLDYDPNAQYGFYSGRNAPSVALATSDFARKITISAENTPPFDQAASVGPRLKVTSQVWWKDRGCPATETVPVNTKCLITLETYLTNWKDY